jgi:hypothetical protein
MDEGRGEGWLTFAAVILIFGGIMRIFDSIWAFRYHGAIPDGLRDAVFGDTLKNYGWIFLGVGIVLILAGVGVMSRSQIGRWVGIVAAVIGGLSAMAWMPYYPVWSVVYVGIAVAVVYALAAYGSRVPSGTATTGRAATPVINLDTPATTPTQTTQSQTAPSQTTTTPEQRV